MPEEPPVTIATLPANCRDYTAQRAHQHVQQHYLAKTHTQLANRSDCTYSAHVWRVRRKKRRKGGVVRAE
eukprot:14721-Heterococcus_DN1.PRE.4